MSTLITEQIKDIVKLSVDIRLNNINIVKTLSPDLYSKECKTIAYSLPRRVGKTTACYELAKHYPNSLLVTKYNNELNHVPNHIRVNELTADNLCDYQFIIFDDIHPNNLPSKLINPDDMFQTFIFLYTA